MQKVLVTGSAGRVGRATVKALVAQGHEVRGFDLCANPHCTSNVIGSIADAALFQQAAHGCDTLIHLAATPDDDDFMSKLLPNNIVGTYNALESARLAGIKRVLLASSGQVVWWWRFTGPFPIPVDAVPAPRGWYAAGKLFLEGAGRAYAETHGLDVVAVRLGWCPRDEAHIAELAGTDWGPDVYLSPADAGRFFSVAIAAPLASKFQVVYACSQPVRQDVFDPAPAARLGYVPLDRWPAGSAVDSL